MVFGGGGGAAREWENPCASGGSGGGIIAVFSRELDVNGSVSATGGLGGNANGEDDGGSGAGGSILLVAHIATLNTNKVIATGGAASGNGGAGGAGRIHVKYQDITPGWSTNPPANTEQADFYILRQLPGAPDNDIELFLPDAISGGDTTRYVTQFGQRSPDTGGGDQLFSVRLPNRGYSSVSLSALVERTAGSGATFNVCLDFGNDSVCDWSPAQQDFSGPVRLDTTITDTVTLATALNTYIQAQASSAESLLIPIRVNIDTPTDIFLFNLATTPGDDIDLTPLTLTISPNNGAAPNNIAEGTPVTLEAVISNTGIYSAENFTVAFYDGDPISDTILVGVSFVEVLGPMVTTTVTQTWNTAGLLGPKTLFVQADAAGNIAETDESNNSASAPAVIRSKADLWPVTLTVPDARAGETVSVTTVISNIGEADLFGAGVTLYEGDPDAGGTPLGSTTVDVPAGGSGVAQINWTPAAAGAITLSIKADPAEAIAEADETNNVISTTAWAGWDVLTIDAGGSGGADPYYDATLGYGRLMTGTVVTSCGSDPEQSYRAASSVNTLDYRLDNLLPSRRYHLDLTFALCSGSRSLDLFVDGQQVGESTLGLAGSTVTASTYITTELQTVSILLDQADYADGIIDLSLQRAEGLGGPLVNLIDLHEIRYCYRDSGPGEPAWSAENDCGYDPACPPEFGTLTDLSLLHLENNSLGGDVPTSITNLVNLTHTDLSYNKLTATDPGLITFLNSKDPDWADTQTIAPTDVYVSGGSVDETTASIRLGWTPIPYTADGGYYEVSYANTPGGPYTIHGLTSNKTASSYLVDNLPVDAPYYFVVRSYTPAHGSQPNDLWSTYSPELLENIGSVGSATITPEEGGEFMASTNRTTMTLSFPPGAVSEPVNLTFQITPSLSASSDLAFLDQPFSITAHTVDSSPVTPAPSDPNLPNQTVPITATAPVPRFLRPFTMTIAYDEASLGGGMDKASLKLYAWYEGANQWAELSSAVDTTANILTASLDHLATFAVQGERQSETLDIYLPILLRDH